ncbi:MAG: acyl-CoA acyltransferase [Xanthobacteraceae bacterium]|nr:acyl-CoA acyltransferase [Xanthobacteraceae bacterium]
MSPSSGMSLPPRVSWRQIEETDVANLIELLTRGFPVRSSAYWQRAFARLRAHRGPPDLPRFGYLLECAGLPVGVVLAIGSVRPHGDRPAVLCNLSSWYVEPAFRAYAPLLISAALRHRDVSFVNVSPAPHTVPIVETQGFVRYTKGQFVAVPALAPSPGLAVRLQDGNEAPDAPFDPVELELMRSHRAYGCLTLWAVTPDRASPFVFLPRTVNGVVPCAELVYCADIAELIRFARPIGRALLRRGRAFVLIDAPGPIAALRGHFFSGKRPKYCRGMPPRVGDLAYTEIPMFGL